MNKKITRDANAEDRYIQPVNSSMWLREELSKGDPKEVIERVQKEKQLKVESLSVLMPLMQWMDLPRSTIHTQLIDTLRDDLLESIENLSPMSEIETLDKLLMATFPYIQRKEMQTIPLAVLKKHPTIPLQFLKTLGEYTELYHSCPLEVKRQIWQWNKALFEREVMPWIEKFLEKEYYAIRLFEYDYVQSRRKREENGILQEQLLPMIGTSSPLYFTLLELIRKKYADTQSVSLCMLRSQLLMAVHDLELQNIYSGDVCHKLAWCLDVCIRERCVDSRRIREIQSFFDTVKLNDAILVDVAMIIRDPHAWAVLCHTVYQLLESVVQKQKLPRDDEDLKWLSQLLDFGLSAHEMLMQKKYKISKLDKDLMTMYYPSICCLLVDDQLNSLTTNAVIEDIRNDEMLVRIVKEEKLPMHLILQYTMDKLERKELSAIRIILPLLKLHLLDSKNSHEPSLTRPSFIYTVCSLLENNKEWLNSFFQSLDRIEFLKDILSSLLIPYARQNMNVRPILLHLLNQWAQVGHREYATTLRSFYQSLALNNESPFQIDKNDYPHLYEVLTKE